METKIRLSSGLQAPCFETVIVALLLVFSKHTDFLIYSNFSCSNDMSGFYSTFCYLCPYNCVLIQIVLSDYITDRQSPSNSNKTVNMAFIFHSSSN